VVFQSAFLDQWVVIEQIVADPARALALLPGLLTITSSQAVAEDDADGVINAETVVEMYLNVLPTMMQAFLSGTEP
jgi:hypothetical protein